MWSRSDFCRTSPCSRRSESALPGGGEPRGAEVEGEGGVSSTGPHDNTHSQLKFGFWLFIRINNII